MFPRFTERLGTAFDLFVEFSTLGEYRLGDSPAPEPPSAPPAAVSHEPGLGGAGGCRPQRKLDLHRGEEAAGRSRQRRSIAGATAGCSPVAAARSGGARRLAPDAPAHICQA
jgi:hypothetical protein